ncbi:MAG: hypothetical protein ACP5VQ_04395 [Phycisphaerae bacterium]
MATNRKKDAATLYEVLGRTAQKQPRKETSATTPLRSAEPSATPSMNNRAPLRSPVTGSIRPPPSAAGPYPPASTATKQTQNPAAGTQLSPEPVLLDQILVRFRPWFLVVAAGIVALILAVIVIVSTSRTTLQKPLEPIAISPGTLMPVSIQPQLLPVNGHSGPSPIVTPPPTVPPRVHIGRVVPAAEVNRTANRWYLVILTTLPQYARRAAEFIAKHGVSVTVENGPQNYKCVISVRGFKHRAGAAAIALRRKVVYIGTLLPDARRAGRSDFNTAYYAHVQRGQ